MVVAMACWRKTASVRSPARTKPSWPATSRSLSSFRAIRASFAPRRRKAAAQAAPMPWEAPVIRTTLPAICIDFRQRSHNSTMPQALLPLFPLGVVLFPRTQLPLHIFEERYKEMMRDVLEAQSEFGVVLAGEKGIVNMGYPDGRMDLLAGGRRRFEILELDDEKPYLRGRVEFFDDDDFAPLPPDTQRRALEGSNDLIQLEKPEGLSNPELSDPQLSFQLAQVVPDVDFRQVLLSTRSELERMKRLADFLPGYTSRQKQTQHMRELAPRNGHGK